MSKEKIKVYLYTRVSTTMQIDGYFMFLYLNFPDLEEMRQMYLQHYK